MDDADRAQEAEERVLALHLAQRPRLDGVAAHDCEECGEEIPEARRAVIGAKLCVDCQSARERVMRR